MGLSSKKTTQTTDQNTTMNTTPTNPGYVSGGIESLVNKIGDVFNADPSQYTAGVNPLQSLAGSNAAGLNGAPWDYGAAKDLTRGVASAASPQTSGVRARNYISDYQNPYEQAVKQTALADYDYGAGITRAQDQLAKAGDATFGGSGGAIQTALSNDAINRGRGALSAQLSSDAFNTALGAAQQDANRIQGANDLNAQLMGQNQDRTLNAAGQLAGISSAYDANQRANIATQSDVGNNLRNIDTEQLQAPITQILQQIAAFGGLPLDLLHGTNQSGTLSGTTTGKTSGTSLGDWLNFFASNAQAAAAGG